MKKSQFSCALLNRHATKMITITVEKKKLSYMFKTNLNNIVKDIYKSIYFLF